MSETMAWWSVSAFLDRRSRGACRFSLDIHPLCGKAVALSAVEQALRPG
jgi:hypothetical protein